MIYRISRVAQDHYLDLDTAMKVAQTSRWTYVPMDSEERLIQSCYVDEFVREVQVAQGWDETKAIRHREFEKQRQRYVRAA